MKRRTLLLALAMLLTSGALSAKFRIPGTVYRIHELAEAQRRAERGEKSLALLVSNEHSSCPLAQKATTKMLERLRPKAVVVYLTWKQRKQLPELAQEALESEAAGKFTPRMVITDPSIRRVLAVVPYARGAAQDRLLDEAYRRLP